MKTGSLTRIRRICMPVMTALDSVRVFVVLTLGLAQNLHEEINMLNVARKVAVDDLTWLFPIYPDEPLPFDEIKKLEGLDLTAAASNNWVAGAAPGRANPS